MMVILSLIQSNQTARMPWGVVIISALIVILGVSLLVYFFRRFKTSEAEAEADDHWRAPGLRLTADRPEAPASGDHGARDTQPVGSAPVAGYAPLSVTLPLASPATPAAEESSAGAEELEPRLRPAPSVSELSPGEAVKQHMAEENAPAIPAPQISDAASPFAQDVWAELEGAGAVPAKSVAPAAPRDPYEPPRIEPIVPRKQATSPASVRTVPDLTPPNASAAERSPRPEVKLVHTPESTPSLSSTRDSLADAVGGPVDVPPAAVAASSAQISHEDMGTLAHYGDDDDDGGGRGGTIALAAIIFIIVAGFLVYRFVPSVHSAFSRARNQAADADNPKAQVFTERGDTTTNLWKMKGTVQNISSDSLANLVVGLSLEPRSEGSATHIDAPVTPDQIGGGEVGTFEFQVDAQQYKGFRITNLKTAGGKDVAFAAPKSSPTVPGQ